MQHAHCTATRKLDAENRGSIAMRVASAGAEKATSAQYQPLSYGATTSFILCSAWPGPQGTMHWTKYSPGLLKRSETFYGAMLSRLGKSERWHFKAHAGYPDLTRSGEPGIPGLWLKPS